MLARDNVILTAFRATTSNVELAAALSHVVATVHGVQ
jgi:hypothetical protein